MVKNHLKRIAVPKTWNIDRKSMTFITRAHPGGHKMEYSMPLSVAFRTLLGIAKTAKEAKQILSTKDVFVDKRKRTEEKYPVGLMDIIEFPQIDKQYRILLDSKGRLNSVEATNKEAGVKLAKILDKTILKGGKVQLNLSDGRNIIVNKDVYAVADTVQLSLPEQKISDQFKFEKGATVLLIGGKHAGMIAKIDDIHGEKVIIKSSKKQFETLKSHTFVVGKDKPALESIKQLTKAN